MPSDYDETYRATRDALRDTVLDVAASLFALAVALAALWIAVLGLTGPGPSGLLLTALGGVAFLACAAGVLRIWALPPFR